MEPSTDKDVVYCSGWFRAKKRCTQVWELEKAKASHEGGQLYTAVLGSRPSCFVELSLARGYVGVGFLDDQLREYLSYQFQEKSPGRLFLTMATHREFADASDRVRKGTTYYFDPNGRVVIERKDFETREAERSESVAALEGNWESVPEFGRYEGVCRKERNFLAA